MPTPEQLMLFPLEETIRMPPLRKKKEGRKFLADRDKQAAAKQDVPVREYVTVVTFEGERFAVFRATEPQYYAFVPIEAESMKQAGQPLRVAVATIPRALKQQIKNALDAKREQQHQRLKANKPKPVKTRQIGIGRTNPFGVKQQLQHSIELNGHWYNVLVSADPKYWVFHPISDPQHGHTIGDPILVLKSRLPRDVAAFLNEQVNGRAQPASKLQFVERQGCLLPLGARVACKDGVRGVIIEYAGNDLYVVATRSMNGLTKYAEGYMTEIIMPPNDPDYTVEQDAEVFRSIWREAGRCC